MIEHRYAPIEYRAESGTIEGIAVTYGDTAKIPGPGGLVMESIRPGAFGRVGDVVANIQHDRQRPIARTGGGGLDLADGPDRLAARISIPDTTDGRDARILLDRGILRGLSVEMRVLDELYQGRERIITRADLKGLAIVDRPAYRLSTAALKRWTDEQYEDDRADIFIQTRYSGVYRTNRPETISDQPGRAVVRKRAFRPGAFDRSINDPDQEIGLLTSRNPNDAIASKLNKTLEIVRDGLDYAVSASKIAQTTAWADLRAKRDAGLAVALQPIIKADSGDYTDIPEPSGQGTALIRTYAAAKLLGFMLTVRPPKLAAPTLSELIRWGYAIPLPV